MRPPRMAELLLRLTIRDKAVFEGVLGDLEEELDRLVRSGNRPRNPGLWYWRATAGLSGRFAFASLPGAGARKGRSPMRDARAGRRLLEGVTKDLVYALRGLSRNPGFALAALLILAVGIGGTVAMFSVVERTLLRPLPFRDPEQLVVGLGTVEGESYNQTVSAHDFSDLRDQSSAFEGLAAQTAWPWISSVTGGERPVRLPVGWVSVDFFRVLGVEPVLGRSFTPDEGVAGSANVAMISHGFWQQSFGGDQGIVGRSINVDGNSSVIVGVAPAGFHVWVDCEVWMPMRLGEGFAEDRRYQNFFMIGRLGPGVPLEQAQSQADVIAADLAAEYPATNQGEGFRLTDLQEATTQSYRSSLFLLLGGVGLLLLIACGNLAALFLARGLNRRTEFSVRVALGASGSRILRQVLLESLVISFGGGLLGLTATLLGRELIVATLPFDLPPTVANAGVSWPLLGFALAVSIGTGILIGITPAIRAARRNAAEGLKAGARTVLSSGTRIRNGLVVAQVALSLVLLISSGLLIRSFAHLRGIEPGFDTGNLLAFDLELPGPEYPAPADRTIFFDALERQVRAIPGVVDVAMINRLPIRTFGGNTYVYPLGERPPSGEQARTANERWVVPGYFEAMGIPVLRGRGIEPSDGPDSPPVLVINERMAQEFFPSEDPLGKQVIIDYDEDTVLEVVGVVGNVRFDGPAGRAFQAMYHSYLQEPVTRMALGIRVAGDAAPIMAAVREAVWGLDPNLPISDVDWMDRVVARTMGDQTTMAILVTLFAWVALVLTALGLYGVLAYFVTLRVPELGLRIALGAGSRDVVRQVARRGLGLLAAGMVLGFAGALGTTRFLQGLLFGVRPTDPLTFLTICLFLGGVGAVACAIPARRALRVDPVTALRSE